MAACAPAAMEEEQAVTAEPASEALDDEEPELVALSPDDHSQSAFRSLGADECGTVVALSAGDDDCQPKFCSCTSAWTTSEPSLGGLGSAESAPGERTYRGLGAAAAAPAAGRSRPDMDMGGVADALSEMLKELRCKLGRFYKGPHLGKLAPLQGVNLVRDPAAAARPPSRPSPSPAPRARSRPRRTSRSWSSWRTSYLQCAANCEGSKANSLFSEFSKQLGQVTESITPKAAEGIIQTVTAMTGSLPAGVF